VTAREYPLPRVERASLDLKLLQTSCASCGLNQLCLPASIGGEDLPRLDQVVQVKKTLDAEQTLYAAGQKFRALYVVRSGAFKTFTLDGEGETQVLGFHLPGEIMGLDAIAGGRHQCSAEALQRSSACEVPYEKIEQVARELPGLQQQLMRVISREVQHDQRHLVMIGRKAALERLAIFLHSLSQRLARVRRDPHVLALPMSRRDLANYLGLVIETVSRLFSRLAEDGVIEVDRRTIRILDPKRLRELAGEVPADDGSLPGGAL
jgi:CRP/FNR family transcriptional regulator